MKNTNFTQAYSMDKYTENYIKQMEDMMSMGKQSSDAWMKFGSSFAKGMEGMMKTCMTRAQGVSEKNANVVKSLMACKTINEVAETQSRLAQDALEDAMSTSAQMSEMTVKMAMECLEPINKQMSDAMRRAQDSMAA